MSEAERKAIYARANQPYYNAKKQIQTETKLMAVNQHMERLQIAAKMAAEEHKQNEYKRLMKWKAREARRAARASVIGNVLGIGGAVVGVAAGGGPMGAMAGYNIGSGVGRMSGG